MLQDSFRDGEVSLALADQYRSRNFDLCVAINITSLGVVLDKMIEDGSLTKNQAECYKQSAHAILQLLRSENNRWYSNVKVL